MRKHLSVLRLYAGSIVYKLLALLAILSVVELAGFRLLKLDEAWSFGQGEGDTFLAACLFAAYAVLIGICLCTGRKSNPFGYTLQRLQISERSVFLWHVLVCVCAFLILWGVQILLAFGLAKGYAASEIYDGGPQGLMMAFYRSKILHSILPLEDGMLWFRNLVYILAGGAGCAHLSLAIRQGEKVFSPSIIFILVMLTFPVSLGNESIYYVFFMGIAALFGLVALLHGIGNAHTGERRVEREQTE